MIEDFILFNFAFNVIHYKLFPFLGRLEIYFISFFLANIYIMEFEDSIKGPKI